MKIPKLYETEGMTSDEKTIYQRWKIEKVNFNWLVAELDSEKNLAFGYANLNNDDNAEWGHIYLNELIRNGATQDKDWKPIKFKEALEKMKEERTARLV